MYRRTLSILFIRLLKCGVHTGEQYSGNGQAYVLNALVSSVLSREWNDFSMKLALFMALCTISANCLWSNFNWQSIVTQERVHYQLKRTSDYLCHNYYQYNRHCDEYRHSGADKTFHNSNLQLTNATPDIRSTNGILRNQTGDMSRVRPDHPRCRSAIWICMCDHTQDVIIYSKFHSNPFPLRWPLAFTTAVLFHGNRWRFKWTKVQFSHIRCYDRNWIIFIYKD